MVHNCGKKWMGLETRSFQTTLFDFYWVYVNKYVDLCI